MNFKINDIIKSKTTGNIYKIIRLGKNSAEGICLKSKHYKEGTLVFCNDLDIEFEEKINHPHTNIFK